MNPSSLIASLDRFSTIFPAAVANVAVADARWKPADGAWSILEIMAHLLDEETRDFRPRLQSTLQDPARPWPPTDPEGWAIIERYNERDLAEVTRQWTAERRASVAWLRTLGDVLWTNAYPHPQAGPLRAGDLLTSWAAHDALHLRQLAKRLFQLAERDGAPYQSRYAGEWHA